MRDLEYAIWDKVRKDGKASLLLERYIDKEEGESLRLYFNGKLIEEHFATEIFTGIGEGNL